MKQYEIFDDPNVKGFRRGYGIMVKDGNSSGADVSCWTVKHSRLTYADAKELVQAYEALERDRNSQSL